MVRRSRLSAQEFGQVLLEPAVVFPGPEKLPDFTTPSSGSLKNPEAFVYLHSSLCALLYMPFYQRPPARLLKVRSPSRAFCSWASSSLFPHLHGIPPAPALCPLKLSSLVREVAGLCLHEEAQGSVRLLRGSPAWRDPGPRAPRAPRPAPRPLRIRAWYPGRPAGARAESAVEAAVERVKAALAVLPLQSPLLLSRDPARYCLAVWGDAIPDAHLQGLALWPEFGSPELLLPDGPGIPDADFLLYVRVVQTPKCHQPPPQLFSPFPFLSKLPILFLFLPQPSVIAYAACCQLGPNDRPLAGTIVFCARRLAAPDYSHSDTVTATVHELLHTLGFSGRLFGKWRDCTPILGTEQDCSPWRRVTQQDELGQLHLITPAVRLSLAGHLGSPDVALGAPLEEEGPSSSHWEARLLQGSVMTSTFARSRHARLDPITLAAFVDMGWYQVNLSVAQELEWGRGAGPDFGLVTTCGTSSSDFFCNGSGLGCHYLHLDKGRCSSDPLLDGCRLYKPLTNRSECWKEGNTPETGAATLHGEIYHPGSRCFLANLTSDLLPASPSRAPGAQEDLSGRCYLHRCGTGRVSQVRVEGAPWLSCPLRAAIQVPGYDGLLFCPRSKLCQAALGPEATPQPSGSPSPPGLLLQLTLGLVGPPGHSLSKGQGQELAQAVLRDLLGRAGTGRCHFGSPALTPSLVFTVRVLESPTCRFPPARVLHGALSRSLRNRALSVDSAGASYTTDRARVNHTTQQPGSKWLIPSNSTSPATVGALALGLCLPLLLPAAAWGAAAFRRHRAALRAGPQLREARSRQITGEENVIVPDLPNLFREREPRPAQLAPPLGEPATGRAWSWPLDFTWSHM
ncbi:leishmanolysin-like peptidase 2 [Tachyglossus aculeatus]|uniref:leishmanolysin-like peptidase 2 n=1 Tax=Tachyglossus aculeatus TaxID=9261 RepID=UPI0018F61E05|nr:leishmanolysin-like peptidase 2 [Tachyglossus aculeatus]